MKKKPAPIVKVSPKEAFVKVEHHTESPVTRREFIARGMMAATSSIFLPSVFGLIGIREAYGQSACTGLQIPSSMHDVAVLVIDGAGGFSGTSMAIGVGADKTTPFFTGATTNSLGWSSEDMIDATTVKGLFLRSADSFRNVLRAPVADALYSQSELNAVLANMTGTLHLCQSNNDTASQRMDPSALISAIQGEGILIKGHIGRLSTRTLPAPNTTFVATKADTVALLRSAVSFSSATFNNPALMGQLAKAVGRLSDSQAQDLSKRSFGRQLASLLGGNVQANTKYSNSCFADLMDPTKLPSISGAFATTNNNQLSIMNALSNLYAPVGTITVGGCDYHNGGSTTAQDRHSQIAGIVQRFFMVCAKNVAAGLPTAARKAMVVITTDGGCGMNSAVGRQPNAISDRGEASTHFILAWSADGPIELSPLGYINSAEAAATNEEVGKKPECVAIAGATTYAALSRQGLSSQTLSLIGAASGLSSNQVLKHNARKG